MPKGGANLAKRALVLKFGGSATTTQTGLNPDYLADFLAGVGLDLTKHFEKAVFVIGGGQRARQALVTGGPNDALAVTRQHAAELSNALCKLGLPVCGRVPTNLFELSYSIAQTPFGVAVGGLQLGQSTDAVAMSAAQVLDKLGYEVVIVVLSNVPAIFTSDPKKDQSASQIAAASVEKLVEMGVLVDNPASFQHGMNVPLDPVAVSRFATIDHHSLFFAGANDTKGVAAFLTNSELSSGTLVKRGLSLCLR